MIRQIFEVRASEQIVNGTSGQLGYTVPFTPYTLENTGQKTN